MNRNRSNRGFLNTRWALAAILIAVSVLLVIAGGRSGLLRPLISAVLAPTSPVAEFLTGATEAAVDAAGQTPSYENLLVRNRELERTLAELQVEIVRLREIEEDYDRLSIIANYAQDNTDQSLVTANVIARDTSSYLRWVIIDRGARDGVQVGNPVINDLGLVGRVEEITASAAWIRLANDPGSAINARLQASRTEGLVVGQLEGSLQLTLIAQDAVVNAGDIVLTSGLGGSFPANIVVGQVTSVRRQQGALFQTAELRSTVNFDDLGIVAVITAFTPIDTTIFDDVIEQEGEEQ